VVSFKPQLLPPPHKEPQCPMDKRLSIQEKPVKYTWEKHGVYESSVEIIAICETY
jgi:hypothetical protein